MKSIHSFKVMASAGESADASSSPTGMVSTAFYLTIEVIEVSPFPWSIAVPTWLPIFTILS